MKNRSLNKILYLLLIIFSIAVIASCGEGSGNNTSNENNSGGTSGGGGGDTTPPTVTSLTPANNAINVALNASVTVNFSEAMDCATLTISTFTLTDDGAPVAGNVTCNGPSATFAPSASLSASTVYTATVATSATDTAGNALTANFVWSFTTTGIKAWGQPTLLETEAGAAGGPAVAADRLNNNRSDGTVIAVWSQDNSIYASRYTGNWSSRTLIGNNIVNIGESAYSPRIAMGDHGQAVVVWGYHNGSNNYSIWSNRFNLGDPDTGMGPLAWQTAQQISPLGSGNANSPQIALDADGFDSFAVWSQYQLDSSQYDYTITQRRYDFVDCFYLMTVWTVCSWNPADYGWSSGTLMLDPHDIGDASEPQVAAWGDNNAVAVWTQNNITGTVGNEIWANVATNGVWSTPIRVNTGSTNGVAAPMVAVDGKGNAFAVWMEWATRRTLYASRYSANTATWSAPVQIDDPTGSNASHYGPPRHAVVMDTNGNALLVWRQENASQTENSIYARRCPGGSPSNCSAPAPIENSTGYADLPVLAIVPNGDAIAVWKQADATGARRIYANHYSASSNSWNANSSLLGGADSTWNEGPQIAIDGNGNATVVWTEYESGQYNIYANRYE